MSQDEARRGVGMTKSSPGDAGVRTVRVPGDKSLTHRALMLAALTDGRSRVQRPLVGADTESTAAALRQLGCAMPQLAEAAELVIDGRGLQGLTAPAAEIDCGNSGTTARLLMGILAGYPFPATLTGDASLQSRPMRRVTGPLQQMGATFEELGASDRLPVRIRGGALRGIDYASPHASAQVKSAILLAGLVSGVEVAVSEPLPSRDHTERMLAELGVRLERASHADGSVRVSLQPPLRISAFDFTVPGDFSSAAFILAFAALHADMPVCVADVGLNPGRTGFLHVLQRMGGAVRVDNERDSCGEPVGDVVASRSSLSATRIDGSEIPSLIDEVPVLAILAARADGTTTITGAGELRVKESDRITAVVRNLQAVGADAQELPDGLVIRGSDRPLRGTIQALHDHRIAMAFGLLAADPRNDIVIDDPDVVAVSFPGFWRMLDTLT
jgi:3-phosphoshikimate 1-carboxyvinyltransferase